MTRRTSWLAFALIAVVGAAVLGLTFVGGPLPEPDPPPAVEEAQPASGSWVCPVGDGREGTELRTITARPLGAGDEPAEVDLEVFDGGERTAIVVPRLFPESATSRSPSLGPEAAVGATWRDGPATLHREWTLADGGDDEFPPGIVAGGCVQPLSDRWIIPGMVTSGGSQSILRIANPFRSDATIGLRFVGTDGPIAPLALRNLSVEGRSTLEIDVNEYLPERDDLTAIVDVASGRVAAQGVQLVRSAIGGIDGVSVLDAAPEAAETWTVPWVVDRDYADTWLWVYNPSDRVAPVELSYHLEDGGDLPVGLSEVLVEPGQLRRVDLRGTFPEEGQILSVTARSDGAPVVVSGAVEITSEDVERTAFTVQLGVPSSDTSWTVSGGPTAGRVEQLHLVNPGSEAAVATVSLFTGATIERPEEMTSVRVPAGGRTILVVADGQTERDAWTAFVSVDEGELVVGRVGGAGEGPRNQVAVPGVPSSTWGVETAGVDLVRTDRMVQRLRTSLGIAVGEAVPAEPQPPAPEDEGPAPPPIDDTEEAPEDLPDDGIDDEAPLDDEVVDDDGAGDDAPGDDEVVEEPDADDADGADDADAEPAGDLPGDGPGAGSGGVPADGEPADADGPDDDGDDGTDGDEGG
jgi:hypothetical protein